VHDVEAAHLDPVIDFVPGQSRFDELGPRHAAELIAGTLRDQLIRRARVTLTVYMPVNVTLAGHGASMAGGVLRDQACV
jgi:hypothetical protein